MATHMGVAVYAYQIGLGRCGLQLKIVILQDIFQNFIYVILCN